MNASIRRLYRLALLALPAFVRSKHGPAMEGLFAREIARARKRGRVAVVVAVVVGVADALRRGAYDRLRGRRLAKSGPDPHRPPGPPREPLGSALAYDVRFALRGLMRARRFTLVAVVTLTLGVGANVALFSVVEGVVLRPLPFPDHERVTQLAWDFGGSRPTAYVSAYKLQFWSERSRAFESMATWRHVGSASVDPEGTGSEVEVLRVSHPFLEVLGWPPALGRDFGPADDVPGSPDVAIITERLWRARFAGDPGALGRTLHLDGTPHTIVGVLPPTFEFPQEPAWGDVLLPLRLVVDPRNEAEDWPILARTRADAEPDAVRADLARVFAELAAAHPELINERDRAMVIASYRELFVGDAADVLWLLLAATGLVLVIACANVAALVLARGSDRAGEMAVRAALGAGRARLARHVVLEGLLLGGAACVLGLGLASMAADTLLGLYPGTLPREDGVGMHPGVVAYALAAALATGSACGVVAALPGLRGHVGSALRATGRGGTGRGRLRQTVLALEAAVSVVLLVGAGLLVATLVEIHRVDPGFDVERLLTAELEPSRGSGAERGLAAYQRRVLDEVRAVPGVVAAAAATTYPLRRGWNMPVTVQGRPEVAFTVEWRSISDDYLRTLDVPLLRGRTLDERDRSDAPQVALVNEAFAARFFPGEPALGKRIEIGRYRDRWLEASLDVGGTEIVGVVGDVREIDLTAEARPTVFVPAEQAPARMASPPVLMVRVRDASAGSAVRGALARLGGGGTAPVVRAMDEVVGRSLAQERFNALLMSILAGVALVLTAFGIYGVASYGVRQQRREIGIRLALGARRWEVIRLVVGRGMAPVAVGLGVGTVAAVGLARSFEKLLWGVETTDPATIAAVALQLAAVAVMASWLPAREATRVDPNRSLRPD